MYSLLYKGNSIACGWSKYWTPLYALKPILHENYMYFITHNGWCHLDDQRAAILAFHHVETLVIV